VSGKDLEEVLGLDSLEGRVVGRGGLEVDDLSDEDLELLALEGGDALLQEWRQSLPQPLELLVALLQEDAQVCCRL